MYGYETRSSYGKDCFFILPTGEFLLADYQDEERKSVHFELFLQMDDIFDPTSTEEWSKHQSQHQLIRLVPECDFMILSSNQEITPQQHITIQDLVENHKYNKHYYENV